MSKTLKHDFVKMLIEANKLKKKDISDAEALQKKKGISLEKALVEKGFIQERDLLELLVQKLNIPFIVSSTSVFPSTRFTTGSSRAKSSANKVATPSRSFLSKKSM